MQIIYPKVTLTDISNYISHHATNISTIIEDKQKEHNYYTEKNNLFSSMAITILAIGIMIAGCTSVFKIDYSLFTLGMTAGITFVMTIASLICVHKVHVLENTVDNLIKEYFHRDKAFWWHRDQDEEAKQDVFSRPGTFYFGEHKEEFYRTILVKLAEIENLGDNESIDFEGFTPYKIVLTKLRRGCKIDTIDIQLPKEDYEDIIQKTLSPTESGVFDFSFVDDYYKKFSITHH